MAMDSSFFVKLLNNLYDGVYFVDHDRIITYWNKGAERLTGYRAEEVIGKSCRENLLVHVDGEGRLLCLDGCPLAATMADGKERQSEIYLHHKDGYRVPVSVRAAPIHDGEGRIVGAVEIFSDNTGRTADRQKIEELQQLAFIDPLTSLVNRRYLGLTLHSKLEEMARYGWPFGVLFLDVDNFKSFNDRYGHETGDEVLKMVARTLSNCLRVFDTVGRWGGEEFVAIVTNIGKEGIRGMAERFRRMVEHSVLAAGGESLRVTISIGATLAGPEDTAESVVKRADALMYQSKLAGRNRVSCDQ